MPTRNNPNLPSSLNRRVIAHKRTSVRTKARVAKLRGSAPSRAAVTSYTGGAKMTRGDNISSKKARKATRNKNYALERKKEQMAEELLKTQGEVEMIDAATVPLSKRQQKLAERAAKVAEDNAKAKAASAAEKAEKERKAAEETEAAGEAEAIMELDDI